jgi:hypothetical protein
VAYTSIMGIASVLPDARGLPPRGFQGAVGVGGPVERVEFGHGWVHAHQHLPPQGAEASAT